MKIALIVAALGATMAPGSAQAASILEQLSPTPTPYIHGVDYGTPVFGPTATDVTASIFRLAGSDGVHGLSLGCSASDFSGGVANSIVLLSRGSCAFVVKAALAQHAGALAVLIAENDPNYPNGLDIGGFDPAVNITAFKLSYGLGETLSAQTMMRPITIRVALGNNLASNLPAVPEPATWAMMILGFGAIGFAMRRDTRIGKRAWPA